MLGETNSISSQFWLALVVGNTRLHWGYFYQESCLSRWHTLHLAKADLEQLQLAGFLAAGWQSLAIWDMELGPPDAERFPRRPLAASDIWIASAVPQQSDLWMAACPQDVPQHDQSAVLPYLVERSHIPLKNIYPTLGIDRAINLLGAGQLVGWPTVVIDAGTAITLTAGVERAVYGGAILPGLRLQSEALAEKTGALSPFVMNWSARVGQVQSADADSLPARWAMDSAGAIASGLTYGITATLIDYLNDWWDRFPASTAIFTGGDAPYLYACLNQRTPEIASRVLLNSDLMFNGMSAYRKACLKKI